jgi:hypothetical protein
MQIQDHDEFPKFDHRVLPPASRRSLGDSVRLPPNPGHAADGRQSRKLGKFQMSQVGRIAPSLTQFNDRETSDGELILKHAGKLGFEGVVSKTIDAPYAPGNRGLWRKAKALHRQEFVVVGWSDPEGSRPLA